MSTSIQSSLPRHRIARLACLLSAAILTTNTFAADSGGAHSNNPKAGQPTGKIEAEAAQLNTLPGFEVNLVLKADPKLNGSWISMAKDPQGRLLLGGQRGQPVTRVTLKDGQVVQQEDMKLPVSETMGMLYAFDSLYINGAAKVKNGVVLDATAKTDKDTKTPFGLFRCTSTKHDDHFDKVEMLREWVGGAGEHGAHAIVLGPDKKLYIVCGNFTGLPKDLAPTSPHKNYADDLVLPRAEDGNGFGAGNKPPGGFIARMDENGQNAEIFASGQRNTYDVAFNTDGELLGFDSDMEWDWGAPWYRPIRVFHAISGGDTGFREGAGKWPEYYPDSLPAVVNVGIGCPTGVAFGTGAKFPAKYQKAFYVTDWTYGRLMAVHLTPSGASYKGTWENFVAPKSLHADSGKTPLNLTDVLIGDDGAMYFSVGGRGTQANLYRVTYTGADSTAPTELHETAGAEARGLRHQLETFDAHQDPKAVDMAWAQIGNSDRFIRYAARIALESQPIDQWRARVLTEKEPEAALTGLLALARLGGSEAQADVLTALAKFPLASMSEAQQLEKLRALEVSISRQGKPTGDAARQIIAELSPMYPAKTEFLNRELCQLLLALDAPDAVAKTVGLLGSAPTQEEQVGYLMHLRTIKTGWTSDLRNQYLSWWPRWMKEHTSFKHPEYVMQWFNDAGRDYSDGASFPNFLKNVHADTQKTLTPEEAQEFASVIAAYIPPVTKPKKPTKARALVKEWKMTDLEPMLAQVEKGRDFARGKDTYEQAQCIACHRFGNDGGAIGPDLTAVASRFKHRDILESIIDPSKVVSDQYKNTTIHLKNNDVLEGRIVSETADNLVVVVNPLMPDQKTTLKIADVKSRALSNISPMPEGLVNTFTAEEILDLIAYLESGGKKDVPAFSK